MHSKFENHSIVKHYPNIYLKVDTLLLTEVFEEFRAPCMKTFSLDPVHYFTAPGLSFDAFLKHTHVELDLLTDSDMVMFIGKGMKGRISTMFTRYPKANSPYIIETFGKGKPNRYITYMDGNKFYGWNVSQALQTVNLSWKYPISKLKVDKVIKKKLIQCSR